MNKQSTGAQPRVVAARALDAVLTGGRNLEDALNDAAVNALPDRDRALAKALAYGAVRNHLHNAKIIALLVKKPFRTKDSIIQALLSVGLYALQDSKRPDYAVVSATVDAAAKLGRAPLKGLVNAILRRFLREREELLKKVAEDPEASWLLPEWLRAALAADWPEDWQAIATAGNQQAPMWVRVNATQITREKWLAELGVEPAAAPEQSPSAVLLKQPLPVDQLPGFAEGTCSVQDIASQQVAQILNPQPGMRVLDACAAPGGKTTHLLESCAELQELIALDNNPERLERVEENLARLQLQAHVVCGDAATPADWWDGELFDRILLDAPCSATGVIRRHPDIRFLRRAEDTAELVKRQQTMLQALWALLKPGGQLLYSTCSVFRAENEAVIADFLRVTAGATELPIETTLAAAQVQCTHGVQLLPGRADNDGFYYALLQREQN